MAKAGRCILLASFAVVSATYAQTDKDAVYLVRDGKPCSVILHSSQPEQSLGSKNQLSKVSETAKELAKLITQISSASVSILETVPEHLSQVIDEETQKNHSVLLLGALAAQKLEDAPEIQTALADPSGFVIQVTPNMVAIAGGSARGTEIGAHALLEQLGVRWFFPGALGTVIPRMGTISLPTQRTISRPTFAARQFQLQGAEDWVRHQRTGGRYFSGAHGIQLGSNITVENHPEVFALVNGVRKGPQLCLSNPETLRLATEQAISHFKKNPDAYWYGMGPEDKAGFCECENCRALDGGDWDPFSGDISMTDRYVWFFNKVLANLNPEYPGKKIAFYIYHSYMRPPVREIPNTNIVGAIAPIALCRVHGMSNPICPERNYLKDLITDWKKLLPEVYERGYWFNLADPGMTFNQTSRLKDEIGYYAQQKIAGFRTECLGNWAVEGPSLYVAGRLMWDASTDVETLIKDYCEKLFGPAATPMREYFTLLDQRVANTDSHTGSVFNISQFYPPDVRKQVEGLMTNAEQLANGTPYQQRVEIFARGLAYSSALAEMLEAQARQDWSTANNRLERLDALREQLAGSYDPPMLNGPAAKSYLDRFFRPAVVQGHARALDNRGMASLQNEWDFLIDPNGVGESLGYYRENLSGGNWQTIPAYTKTWSDLGLRYYKGLSWYRQKLKMPDEMVGKRVFLWFGGVDESARVWVNGKLAGNSPRSAFTPFELDVTDFVQKGENRVVVCVANRQVDELGTGGITSPAFFYAPSQGASAKLENIKPLRETFP